MKTTFLNNDCRHSAMALGLLFASTACHAQTYENQFRQPLIEVFTNIEKRFHVTLHFDTAMANKSIISFAPWRIKNDLASTLNSLLPMQDLVYQKLNDTTYNIGSFQYFQKPVEEGSTQLTNLLASYKTLPEWQARKAELRACMLKTLRLQQIPAAPASAPVVTNYRKLNGYSVVNIAIETLPGLYVCGSLYKPLYVKGKLPVIMCPTGHFGGGRYRADMQYRCAALARMGAMVFSYDLLGWGESRLTFRDEDHYTSTAMTVQTLNSFRILDYLGSLKDADTSRIAITGASGGGSQTMLITALTNRIKVSAPVVMVSCYFMGGCPCESGLPIHACGFGTNNVEIAAMAAPRPQLIVSDGKDWTDHVPQIEFPYLQKMYGLYGGTNAVSNVHLPNEEHDYGFSKRQAMYVFMASNLQLDLLKIKNTNGRIDETNCVIEEEQALFVFGNKGEKLPENTVKGIIALRKLIDEWLPVSNN